MRLRQFYRERRVHQLTSPCPFTPNLNNSRGQHDTRADGGNLPVLSISLSWMTRWKPLDPNPTSPQRNSNPNIRELYLQGDFGAEQKALIGGESHRLDSRPVSSSVLLNEGENSEGEAGHFLEARVFICVVPQARQQQLRLILREPPRLELERSHGIGSRVWAWGSFFFSLPSQEKGFKPETVA